MGGEAAKRKGGKHGSGGRDQPAWAPKTPAERTRVLFASKYLLHVEGAQVKVTQAESGETLCVLKGHGAPVTSACLSPWNSLQVFTCDRAGCVKVWDYQEGRCVETMRNTGAERVEGNFAVFASAPETEQTEKKEEDKEDKPATRKGAKSWAASSWKVFEIEKPDGSGKLVRKGKAVMKSSKGPCRQLVACNADHAHYVAAVCGRNMMLLDVRAKVSVKINHDRPLTTAALHPSEDTLAFGDTAGRISVLRKRGETFTDSIRSTLHWHAHGVTALAFSGDGASLLSGGDESVLVIWQLGTGAKDFLPRLGGGALHQICSTRDGVRYAVALESGMIRVIDSRTRETGLVLQDLTASTSAEERSSRSVRSTVESALGVVVDPRSGAVLAQKSPGVLQFYDVENDRLVKSLDVAGRNNVAITERSAPTYVEHAVFAPGKGDRLVTVERVEDRSALKFWALVPGRREGAGPDDSAASSAQHQFKVTTHVEQPHNKPLTALLMHPSGHMVVTAADNKFKVWNLKHGSTGEWACRSVGFYKESPITAAALSPDGSVLAVAYDKIISLWNPAENSLIGTLAQPCEKGIASLCFFRQNLLASATASGTLAVWDMVRRTVCWSLRFESIPCLATNESKLLVVAGKGKHAKLFVFSDGPVPDATFTAKSKAGGVVGVAFAERSGQFLFANAVGQILPLAPDQKDGAKSGKKSNKSKKAVVSAQASAAPSTFSLIQEPGLQRDQAGAAHSAREDLDMLQVADASADTMKMLEAYPSYVLPPLSKLMTSMLGAAPSSEPSEEGGNNKRREEEQQSGRAAKRAKKNKAVPAAHGGVAEKASAKRDAALQQGMTAFFQERLFSKKTVK